MIEQGSEDWFKARIGKVTASRLADVIAKTKTGWGASRANYAAQLIAERLTGVAADSFTNAAMQWGTGTEPKARAAYCLHTGNEVAEVGFIDHPRIPMTGASPDGLVGDDGLIEIKCPGTAKHVETILGDEIDGKYLKQMYWQMACTGRMWCDFVSFDPRLPLDLQLKVKRVERDDAVIGELEAAVEVFLREVEDKLARLKTHRGEAA